MRVRHIKPDFFVDEDIGRLPIEARLAFIALWTVADRAGRIVDRPQRLRVQLFPYDLQMDFDAILTHLATAGFIDRYEVDTMRIIQIRTWDRHQHPHPREQYSTLPEKSTCLGNDKAMTRHVQGNDIYVPRQVQGNDKAMPCRALSRSESDSGSVSGSGSDLRSDLISSDLRSDLRSGSDLSSASGSSPLNTLFGLTPPGEESTIADDAKPGAGPPKYPPVFIAIWLATGKRGSKYPAFKAWSKAKPTLDEVTRGWKRWQVTDQWRKGFIPHLSTWLNARGWEDEPDVGVGGAAIQAPSPYKLFKPEPQKPRPTAAELDAIRAEFADIDSKAPGVAVVQRK